jgi:hypothetical protein
MTKKPALLSESLLAHRPRKGEAKPQTETQASVPEAASVSESRESQAPTGTTPARRRKRRSQNTQQLNLRVSEETLERFTKLADTKNLIFGDLLALLLNEFDSK